ncbi:MAG: endonuclease/exonuclease/phosphatase family protein [Rhodothermales bacterium]
MKTYLIGRFFLLLVFGVSSISCDAQSVETAPAIELVAMTYNIRHGAGADGEVNLERIANVILSAQPDIVAVQEVDRFVERTNRADQATQLADLTGMHMRFGFADNYQGGDFGNLILSKHPIDSLALHPLPGPPGETRVLMEALIHIGRGDQRVPVTFMSTHLETIEFPRRASAPLINNTIPVNPQHLYILGGDLNATPQTPTMDTLAVKWTNPVLSSPVFTFPADSPDRQIDYLLYNAPATWSVKEVFALDAPISSDHAPLVAVFKYE